MAERHLVPLPPWELMWIRNVQQRTFRNLLRQNGFCEVARQETKTGDSERVARSTPTGSRTPAPGLRIRCPRPLDYGGKL